MVGSYQQVKRHFRLQITILIYLITLTSLSSLSFAQPSTPLTQNGVTAHRGYSGAYPENTLAAFENAIALGVDWLECDIFLTADDQIVVTHDRSTLKLTGVAGDIKALTYDEVLELDTAVDFRFRTGLSEERVPPAQMPLLKDVLELVMAQDKTRLSIQPKDESTAAAVALVHEMGATAWVGFNDGSLEKMSLVKELDLSIPVFWDRWSVAFVDEDIEIALDRGFEALVYNEHLITTEAIHKVQDAGLEFGVWTVNDSRQMREFVEMGVDRLYTDHPHQALTIFGVDDRTGLSEGLLSYWRFDDAGESSHFIPNDGSSNPLRDAMLQGDAALNRDGKVGGALGLDGDEDYADVAIEVWPDGVPAYTVSLWVKPTEIERTQQLLQTTEESALSLTLLAGGYISYRITTTGEHVFATSAEPLLTEDDKWHHVALTYDEESGQTQLYFDGHPQTMTYSSFFRIEQTTGTLADTDGLLIGTSIVSPNNDNWFYGSLDELAVWNRVLSNNEITQLWNGGSGNPID
jgi:glycerophosphoryl diester phosphodiesterase